MKILGIESSCDETAASVVEDGRNLLSNVVATQISVHALYGGVVPEIASRAHAEAISGVVTEALEQAGVTMDDIDAIAVTYGPGLIGALLVGLSFAKGLAYSSGKPLVPVHHIHGHVAANYLSSPELKPPFYALVVSGGHTSLMYVADYSDYRIVGHTRDDAAGESFDKVGRVLGLPYPGGAAMDKLASLGDSSKYKFSVSVVHDSEYDFSFSGLKTSAINLIHTSEMRGEVIDDAVRSNIAASFTKAVVSTVTTRLEKLLSTGEKLPIVLAGGVAANSHLRKGIGDLCGKYGVKCYMPPLKLCGDNGAMIAAQGYYDYISGNRAPLSQNAFATKEV